LTLKKVEDDTACRLPSTGGSTGRRHGFGPSVKGREMQRIIEKLDEYLRKNDYAGAERHLRYWIADAVEHQDLRKELSLTNELMGLCRKLGRREDAVSAAERALELMEMTGLADGITGATTRINAATVFKAFDMSDRSIPLFERALAIYESSEDTGKDRLGGLYNNYALALADMDRFAESLELFQKALSVMERVPEGRKEQAITWLNMADVISLTEGDASVGSYLEKAKDLLEDADLTRDGRYAFVCEKCAPSFGYYGMEEYARTLLARAEMIYREEQRK